MKTTNTGVSAIVVNILLLSSVPYLIVLFFYPDFERFVYYALLIVVLYSFSIYLLKRSKYTKIIRACGLGKDGIYAKHKSSKKTSYGVDETFSLVPGMCLSDFKNKNEPISQYLNKKVEFEYFDKNIIMKIYDYNL